METGEDYFMSHTCRLSREHAVLTTELLRTSKFTGVNDESLNVYTQNKPPFLVGLLQSAIKCQEQI